MFYLSVFYLYFLVKIALLDHHHSVYFFVYLLMNYFLIYLMVDYF